MLARLADRLARLAARPRGEWRARERPTPAAEDLPAWAQTGKRRRAHIERVAELLEE